jgi:acetyl-CoA synthetase
LLAHPGVAECAVIGTPDEARGEVVHAFVVPRDVPADAAAFISELQDWVRTQYAAHAYPRIVTLTDELPKTPSGKIQRAELRRVNRPAGDIQ